MPNTSQVDSGTNQARPRKPDCPRRAETSSVAGVRISTPRQASDLSERPMALHQLLPQTPPPPWTAERPYSTLGVPPPATGMRQLQQVSDPPTWQGIPKIDISPGSAAATDLCNPVSDPQRASAGHMYTAIAAGATGESPNVLLNKDSPRPTSPPGFISSTGRCNALSSSWCAFASYKSATVASGSNPSCVSSRASASSHLGRRYAPTSS